jgi:hypothetical protein
MGYRNDTQPDLRNFDIGGAFMGGYRDALEDNRRKQLVELEQRQQGFQEQRYGDMMAQQQQQAQAQAQSAQKDQALKRSYARYISGDKSALQAIAQLEGLSPEDLQGVDPDQFVQASIAANHPEILKALQGDGGNNDPYTLSPGSGRYDAKGKLIVQQPFAPANDRIVMMGGGYSAVDPRSHEVTALTTPQQEREAAAGLKAAEAGASAQAQAGVEGTQKAVGQQSALGLWDQALSGLREGLAGTETGPIMGRLPAFTGAQQKAESAVAALAPVLKQIFRVAGEGTFTDRDQAMLLDMIPTRKVDESVREDVIANIDSIVRAKLNSAQAFQVAPSAQGGGKRLSPEEASRLPPGSKFIGLDGKPRVKH